MYAPQAFSFERALRITSREEPRTSAAGLAYRESQLLDVDVIGLEQPPDVCCSVQFSPRARSLNRLFSLDAMALRHPTHCVLDGRTGLMLTYVLRTSLGGVKWRDSRGESAHLQPGALHVSQARHDTLVELAPAVYDQSCECVRMVFRTDLEVDLAASADADGMPHCTCLDAGVRVLVGRYRDHAASLSPMSGLTVLDIQLDPLTDIDIPVAPDHWGLALVTSGSLQCHGVLLESTVALAFLGQAPLARLATQTGATVLWLDVPYAIPQS